MPLRMRHPDIEVLGEAVSEDQFRTVWEPRGWQLVPAELILAADHFGRSVGSLDDLGKDELLELAAVNRVELKGNPNKNQIAKAIADSQAVAVVEATNTETVED